MKVIESVKDFNKIRKNLSSQRIGFVPTMGALHEGHLSLVRKAKSENDIVVVSIYVNETQFNDSADLKNYPIEIDQDKALLQALGVDVLFLPTFKEIYPDNYKYRVIETENSLELCGKNRPGHFDGVLTVVLRLLNIVRPQKAYFGEKDYQQKSLIEGMVKALFLEVKIISCPIQRDEQGLALSSRNKKLSLENLKKAQLFAKAFKETKDLHLLEEELLKNGVSVDYLVEKKNRRFGAVRIGNVRLIDNVEI